MENAVYRGELLHHRILPVQHSFNYAHVCLFTDIENIPAIAGLSPLVSVEKPNLLSFYRQDFLPSDRTLHQEVCGRIHQQTGRAFSGKVYLLANWRTCGVTMNPLALFYCYEEDALRYVVAEVHNTPWNERHVYVLVVADAPLTSEKNFHVSPFMPMNLRYGWGLDTPGHKLNVSINADQQGKKLFSVVMRLNAQPMTKSALHKLIGRFPIMAVRTLTLIYYQAFRLWLKRVPIHFHPRRM